MSRVIASQYWRGLYASCGAKTGVLKDLKKELIRGLDGFTEDSRLRMER